MTGSESPGRPQFHLEMHPLLLPTNASSDPAKTNYLFFLQTITLMSIEKSPSSQLRKPEQRLRLLLKLVKERVRQELAELGRNTTGRKLQQKRQNPCAV